MAERRAIVNASPLILLSSGGYVEFLQLLNRRVVVPDAVAAEIEEYGADDPTARVLHSIPWLHIEPSPQITPDVIAWDLGPGESSVLTMSRLDANSIAVLDDRAARRCAAALHVPVVGTLGLVLIAEARNVIPYARPVVEHLRNVGMYLSDAVVNEALALVGE